MILPNYLLFLCNMIKFIRYIFFPKANYMPQGTSFCRQNDIQFLAIFFFSLGCIFINSAKQKCKFVTLSKKQKLCKNCAENKNWAEIVH